MSTFKMPGAYPEPEELDIPSRFRVPLKHKANPYINQSVKPIILGWHDSPLPTNIKKRPSYLQDRKACNPETKRRCVTLTWRPVLPPKPKILPIGIQSMPPELLSEIFAHVGAPYDSGITLRILARVCKRWSPEALRLLWREIALDSQGAARGILSCGGFGKFHTQTVFIGSDKQEEISKALVWCHEMLEILMMCPRLRHLNIDNVVGVPVDLFYRVPLPQLYTLALNVIFEADPLTELQLRYQPALTGPILPTSPVLIDVNLYGFPLEKIALEVLVNQRLAGSPMGTELILYNPYGSPFAVMKAFEKLSPVVDGILVHGPRRGLIEASQNLVSSSNIQLLRIRHVSRKDLQKTLANVHPMVVQEICVQMDPEELETGETVKVLQKTLDFLWLKQLDIVGSKREVFDKLGGGKCLVETLEKSGVEVNFYSGEDAAADE